MAKRIHDKNRLYFTLRWYVDFMFKSAYRKVEYWGKEHIPRDGAIIYAPNHVNTLMDPLAVLAIDQNAKVFVARADIFRNPLILKFLTFLKMLPIHRKRDGVATLAKNEEISDIVVDVLQDGVPFCILPEGTHRAMHSLMPLVKGIFRIALQANDTFGDKMPVYLVPVGVEYGHFFRYRSSILVQIGEPINVTQFVRENSNMTVPQQIHSLRDNLSQRMKDLILHIKDDLWYLSTFALAQLYGKEQQQSLKLEKNSLMSRLLAAKKTVQVVNSFLESNPEETQRLLRLADDFARQREALGIGIESLFIPHIRSSVTGKFFLLILGLPYFIFSFMATAPVTLLSVFLCSKFEDKAFHNTVRFLISILLLPLLLLTGCACLFATLPWMWGVGFVLLFLPSFFYLHEYLRLWRRFISDIKFLIHRDLRKQFKNIKILTTQLIT